MALIAIVVIGNNWNTLFLVICCLDQRFDRLKFLTSFFIMRSYGYFCNKNCIDFYATYVPLYRKTLM